MHCAIGPVKAGVYNLLYKLHSRGSYSRRVFQHIARPFHDDGRRRLSAFWVPTGGIAQSPETTEDAHSMLIRGGFIRQAHSGLFQLLPLGLRIQEKIERLLDKHMAKIGASKVSLSAFSSEELWKKSGRLKSGKSELFTLEDRKLGRYHLSPTHEEEITSLVSGILKSYKELPLRLYQITRKYRDELRPRQGLLRAREFLMKDLYTFDTSKKGALKTYETVRNAYAAFFNEFKIPYLTAEASSGEIGGELSHEYHLPSLKGEDQIITCTSCSYAANEELAGLDQRRFRAASPGLSTLTTTNVSGDSENSQYLELDSSIEWEGKYSVWRGISENRSVLYEAIFPSEVEAQDGSKRSLRSTEINRHVLKNNIKDIDLSVEDPTSLLVSKEGMQDPLGRQLSGTNRPVGRLYDYRLPQTFIDYYEAKSQLDPLGAHSTIQFPPIDLVKFHTGDKCLKCSTGTLKVQTAIELGHTFHLGTRYSEPLQATFTPNPFEQPDGDTTTTALHAPQNSQPPIMKPPTSLSFLQMGCHGIGVSRMIAAVAESLCDSKGLNWPRVMAPFDAVIIPTKGLDADAAGVYDFLVTNKNNDSINPGVDAILDDRDKYFGWKLKDADLIGYPVIVVLGRTWRAERTCEVQCRRLDGWKEIVEEGRLREVVQGLLDRL